MGLVIQNYALAHVRTWVCVLNNGYPDIIQRAKIFFTKGPNLLTPYKYRNMTNIVKYRTSKLQTDLEALE